MAWRPPTIYLKRAAVAEYVNPDTWPMLDLLQKRNIAANVIADEQGQSSSLAQMLVQGNPNLCDIQIEQEFFSPA